MYIRVTRARIDPARFEEVQAIGREIVAANRRLPGLQGYHTGVDRASGRIVAISFWDTEEHAQVPREGFAELARRLEAAGVQLEPTEYYEESTPA
jgi:quinol monooxygenase YgiN